MKVSMEKIEEGIAKAKTNLEGKEGLEYRQSLKKVKRLQRRKSKVIIFKKNLEEKSKKKTKEKTG